ncbi:MAG: penicillin-binding protein activator [Thermodesulfobacteriota bacterium]|nr:penicillin-binding protein activator [Thermodesulfobacteriota bacterium]
MKNIIIIFITAFFFAACAPKQVLPPRPVYVDPGDILFAQAEELFQAKLYEKALIKHTEYLSRFPNGRLADAALIKTGAAWSNLGNNAKALSCYNRLIEDYPKSPFIPDAMVEILVMLYSEGKYNEAIKQANDIIGRKVAGINIVRTYVLLGDAHFATGFPKDAVNSYILALNKAKGPAKEPIIAKINEAAGLLGTADIIFFLTQLKDKPPAGYLMYRLGQSKAEKEKYDDAERILSQFIERFPEHENALKAQKLIEEIRKKGVYSKYTIGCLLPLSGPCESFGRRALKGIEFAMNQFCSQGIQPAVKLIIKDTKSDADKAAAAVRELFDEHVAAIIGPIFTAESAALAAQDKGIPIITITQKNNIADIGNYVFRNFFTPMMQVHTLVSYAIEELGLGNFAILYPDDNYGTTFMNLFWDEVTAYGGKVVGIESYNVEHTDFADPIKKLVGLYYEVPEDIRIMDTLIEDDKDGVAEDEKAGKNDDISEDKEENKEEQEPEAIVDFDAVFIPDAPERAGLIIPQLAFYDVKDVYLLGTNLWHCDSLIKMARRYVQNAIMPDVFFAESSSKQVTDFVAVFKQTFKEKPEFVEAVAYDSAMILFKIVSRPDIRYRSSIKSALMNLNNFQGVTGLTSFNNNGEIKKRLYLLRIKGNKFIELN